MIGNNVFEGCDNLKRIVFPSQVNDLNGFSTDSLVGAAIQDITFLGITLNSSAREKIIQTKLFGLDRDCILQDKTNKYYGYSKRQNTVVRHDEYDVNSNVIELKSITDEKFNLKFGKVSRFRRDVVEYCFTNKIPFIVMYSDSMTSVNSKDFYSRFFDDNSVIRALRDVMCPIMFLDRKNNTQDSSTMEYYRTDLNNFILGKQQQYGQPQQGFNLKDRFVNFTFVYDNGSRIRVLTKNHLSFQGSIMEEIKKACDQCGFGEFDPTPYYVKIDIPEYETEGSRKINEDPFKNLNLGFLPWWYQNGDMKNLDTFDMTQDALDWHDVWCPENSYFILMGYDEKYGNIAPLVDEVTQIMKNYTDNIEVITDDDTYQGMMCEKLQKGLDYKFMFFFEFSHGAVRYITVDKGNGPSRTEIWQVLKNSHNRILGMFDSCYGGSMIEEQRVSSSNIDDNKRMMTKNVLQDEDDNETISEYLIRMFNEQKLQRMKMLQASNSHEPTIELWSGAPSNKCSIYYPGKSSCFVNGFKESYTVNKYERIGKFFDVLYEKVKKHYDAFYSGETDIGPPERKTYGNDVSQHKIFD